MEEARCAAHLFTYNEDDKVPLKTFFSYYRHGFPMLAVIIDGHYGETIFDCFENFQVFRIHCYSSQPRVICTDSKAARATDDHYYTIPVNTKHKFQKIKGHSSVGEPQTLSQILAENDQLPVMAKLACSPDSKVQVGSDRLDAGNIGNLLITKTYEENYLMVNSIDTTGLKMNAEYCLVALTDEITATPITGFKYKCEKEYQTFLKRLDHEVATSGQKYDKTIGDPDFATYKEDEDNNIYNMPKMNLSKVPSEDEDYEAIYELPDAPARKPKPPPAIPTRATKKNKSKDKTEETKQQKTVSGRVLKTATPDLHEKPEQHEESEYESPPIPERKFAQTVKIDPGRNKRHRNKYENTEVFQATVRPITKAMAQETVNTRASDKHQTRQASQKEENTKLYTVAENYSDRDYDRLIVQVAHSNEMAWSSETTDDSEEIYMSMSDFSDINAKAKYDLQKRTEEEVKDTKRQFTGEEHTVKHSDVKDFTINQVVDVLHNLKLDKYARVFKEEQIDGDMLARLTVDDMVKELKMRKLEALRLSRYVETGHVPK